MDTRPRVLSTVTPTACVEAHSFLSLDLTTLTTFDEQLRALLPKLTEFADVQLLQLAAHARQLEACAFRLRGACVAELRRRIAIRLFGGRGKRDASGIGIKAQLAQLAAQIGVSPTTLKTDARIHEVFFAGETRLARETSLPREFYVTALGAPDPLATIQLAEEKAADKSYTREQFRRDVRALKPAPKRSDAVVSAAATPKATGNLRVKIMPEAQAALAELVERSGQSPDAIVAEAILAHHKSLTTAIVSPGNKRHPANSQPCHVQPTLPLFQGWSVPEIYLTDIA
jgi:hypothetical protein